MKIVDVLRVKAHALTNKIRGNPVEELDYAYDKQVERQYHIKKAILKVATAKNRLEKKAESVLIEKDKVTQAIESVNKSDTDLVRELITQELTLEDEHSALNEQIGQVNVELKKLVVYDKKLTTKIDAFRAKKDILKAQYCAYNTLSSVKTELSGLNNNSFNVGLTIENIHDKIEDMKATSEAVDTLTELGVVKDVNLEGKTELQTKIDKASLESRVNARLKEVSENV